MTKVRFAVVGLAVVLLLTGCSGEDDDGGGSGGSGGSSGSGDLSYEDSPLAQLWESAGGSGDSSSLSEAEQLAEWDAMNLRAQELIAQCMAEQGFDYNPENVTSAAITINADEGLAVNTLEYAQQYGYGITTWEDTPEGQAMAQDRAEEYVDPNQDILDAMSESEQQAWYEALYGGEQDATYDENGNATYEYDWEKGGCQGAADHEVYEDVGGDATAAVYEDPQFAELIEQMSALYEEALNSPEMQQLDASWADCLADAGFAEITSVEDAYNAVNEKANALYQNTYDEDSGEHSQPDAAAMQEVKDYEIAVATADFTCRAEVDYEDEQLRIEFALEQEFVDANREALDAFIAAMLEAQGSQG